MKYNTASVIVFRKDGKIAFLLRQNTTWMDGHYGLPGGKVEPGESFTQAAIREAKEEVGVELGPENLDQVFIGHALGADGDVWVNAVFEAHDWQGELVNAEPNVHAELAWFEENNLDPKVIPIGKTYLEQIAAGNHYAEIGWDS
ncbi:MAG TPA: NUDIX domain-containing protein [Methylomirabilota bacterium]|nr:NUDIX domain-containing protein [Methylomirabilota bacterium]